MAEWREPDWKNDERILAIRQRYESEGATPEVVAALREEVPRARLRAMMSDEYGPVMSAMVAAGSEMKRMQEGVTMLFADLMDDDELLRRTERSRAIREKTMQPLEEARPISTTIGEILPSFAVPGGAAGGLARRALTSGLAGGGYEYAASGGDLGRAAIAAPASAVGNEAGRLLGRYFLGQGARAANDLGPNRGASPEHTRMVGEAQEVGLGLTPAQQTGNPVLAQYESSMKRSPYMSGPFFRAMEGNQELANRTAREAMGLQGDDLITDAVLRARHQDLGAEFERLVGGDETFPISTDFADRIDAIRQEYGRGLTRRPQTRRMLENMRQLSDDQYISVQDYQQIASDLASTARSTARKDAPGGRALYAAREALDDEFDATFGDLPDLQRNRRFWRRLRQIEESRAIDSGGQFRPGVFARYLKRPSQGRGVVWDQEPIGRLSEIALHFQDAIPDSGTPTGMSVPDFLDAPLWRKVIMGGGGGISGAYLQAPHLATGPGTLGYLPPGMMLEPQIQFQPFGFDIGGFSPPVETITSGLQRFGRAQGVEASQGEGMAGGLL